MQLAALWVAAREMGRRKLFLLQTMPRFYFHWAPTKPPATHARLDRTHFGVPLNDIPLENRGERPRNLMFILNTHTVRLLEEYVNVLSLPEQASCAICLQFYISYFTFHHQQTGLNFEQAIKRRMPVPT